jgi:hypothetical protein
MKAKTTILLLITALIVSSCAQQKARRYSPSYAYRGSSSSETTGGQYKEFSDKKTAEERMIAYDASIDLIVKEPDSTLVTLKNLIKEQKGYIVSISSSTVVFRVETTKLESTLKIIETYGKTENKRIWGEDVTDEYQDLGIRLENAMKARERYLQLLEKAENVQAALMVEKELERLNGEIDLLKGRIKRLEHITEYSSITVYIKEKVKPGIVGYVFVGVYKGVKWLFVRN